MADPISTEVVVVGAGAAGLAAGEALRAAGIETVILEASERIGGRAYTDSATLGVPFDVGCQWFHSASRNPLAALALERGWAFDERVGPRAVFIDGKRLSPAESRRWERFAARQFARVEEHGRDGVDVAASEVLAADPGFDALYEGWFAMLNGVEPPAASTLEHARYLDTGEDWRSRGGYGAFIVSCFPDVPVVLGCPVHRIEWGTRSLRVDTGRGRYDSRTVVLTVSTAVLASGAIEFAPSLPREKRAAIRALPLGNAERVGLALSDALAEEVGAGHRAFSALGREVVNFQLRPCGYPIAIGYFGGGFARRTAADGRLVETAGRHLGAVLGRDVTADLGAAIASSWSTDPLFLGAYSAARPGEADARLALAAPLAGRLFFAGEATSPRFFSTAHGAYESGRAAAREVAEALGHQR